MRAWEKETPLKEEEEEKGASSHQAKIQTNLTVLIVLSRIVCTARGVCVVSLFCLILPFVALCVCFKGGCNHPPRNANPAPTI